MPTDKNVAQACWDLGNARVPVSTARSQMQVTAVVCIYRWQVIRSKKDHQLIQIDSTNRQQMELHCHCTLGDVPTFRDHISLVVLNTDEDWAPHQAIAVHDQ